MGTPVARYTQGLNIDEPLAMLRSTTTSFYEVDGLGSISSLTNSSGANAATYTYDSFGNLTASSGSLTNSFRYTAREFDTETGLYYYRARYYDPGAGRFISEDTIRFAGGVDFYAYVHNNSANLTDPLGLCGPTVSHCLGVAAAAKGLSIGLDILGAIPAVGNVTSATSGIARAAIAVDHVVTSPIFSLASGAYGGYGAVTGGTDNPVDSLVGLASSSTGIGLILADVSLGGTKAIPVVGNAISVLTLGWDAYQAYNIYQGCMGKP